MPQFYTSISDELKEWALKQSVFFTATAPSVGSHINVSPKGHTDTTFAVLSPNQVAYYDSTGSGNETIAHLYENGRITILFCSFGASPRILRFFCTGNVVEIGTPQFTQLAKRMADAKCKPMKAARAIILMDVWKVQVSCGYGVPILTSDGFAARDTLSNWGDKTFDTGKLPDYQIKWNTKSLDGCKGLKIARRNAGEWLLMGDVQAWLKKVMGQWDAMVFGVLMGIFLMVVSKMLSPHLTGVKSQFIQNVW